jgi:hypothetical protein
MQPKLGRNAPCYCGSGRKYKKCHLPQDEALGRAPVPVWERGVPAPAPEDDLALPVRPARESAAAAEPTVDAAGAAFWERFNAADAAERVTLYEEQLAAGVGRERLFEMLATLHDDAAAAGDRARFRVLVERARARAPDAYRADLLWYHSWLIEDAVAERAYALLPELVAPLPEVAEQDIDELFRLIDLLMFHDQLDVTIDLMRRAWPVLSASSRVLPYGLAAFAARLTMLHLFAHVRRGGAPRADDPDLQAALAPLGLIDQEHLTLALVVLAGSPPRLWTPADFVHDPHPASVETAAAGEEGTGPEPPVSRGEPAAAPMRLTAGHGGADGCLTLREHLFRLSLEWAVALEREQGVPPTRTELVRDLLTEYLLDRPPGPHGRATLLPDRRSVEERLVALLSPLSGLYHQGGTFFALLPTFVDFLAARGLVRGDEARGARAALLKLRPTVLRIVREGTGDPALHELVAAVR